LKNGRGSDNEISRRVWEEMENRKTDKARMVKTKREKRMEREGEEERF